MEKNTENTKKNSCIGLKEYSKPSLYKIGVWQTMGGKAKNETEASKLGKIS